MINRRESLCMLLLCAVCGSGCAGWWHRRRGPDTEIPNPMLVAVSDQEFVWNQIVDTVDDYFRIRREEGIRQVGGVITAGRIETQPEVGATILEPHRRDSTPRYQRWLSTLQTVRRRALVTMAPTQGGYAVHVQVDLELEDVNRPQRATVGGSALRHDGGIVRTRQPLNEGPVTLGWINKGRDFSLEQQILAEIQARVHSPPARAL